MEQMIQNMMKKVDDFQTNLVGRQKGKYGVTFPDMDQLKHLAEEVDETMRAGTIEDVVDGLVDVVYVALGMLVKMGVPPDLPFDAVHEANMKKIPMKTSRMEKDAVKPDGWAPPDHAAILEHLEILRQVSPVFVDLTRLRIRKGNNYNRGNVRRMDHFPLGDLSFFQVVWMKMCRIRSLVECPDDDSRRLVERELNDVMVYSCFWAEFLRGLEL